MQYKNNFFTAARTWSFLMALAVVVGCGVQQTQSLVTPSSEQAVETDAANTVETLPSMGAIPEFSLVDQSGVPFTHAHLDGQITVVNFFFSQCTATCPQQTREIARLQQKLAGEDQVRFVSVSVQPEVDTPETLVAYARQFEANHEAWSFVTGDREALWRLSGEGFRLPVGDAPNDASMPIFHSSKFVLVDGARNIRGYYESTSPQSLAELTAAIEMLAGNGEAVQTAFTAITESPQDTGDGGEAPSLSDLEAAVKGAFNEPDATKPARDIFVPSKSGLYPLWMAERQQQQLDTRSQFQVPHDFKFTDRQPESGIEWSNQVVEDAGKTYVAAHYDHGNGVAIADLDHDGLYDVYFTTQMGGNALYRNLGNGRFEDMTDTANVALADRVSVTGSFADYDNDGDADLFVTTVRGGNALFRNDGGFRFTDVTKDAGVEYSGHSSAAVFFDFDRDGLLDLFVTNVGKYTTNETGVGGYYRSLKQAFAGHLQPELTEKSILYRNVDGKRFVDVTEQMGLVDDSWSGEATPIDVNEDGWPDVYTTDMQGHDEYFENLGGKGFRKRSREVFPKTPWGAMSVKVFDYNNDGRMDVYVTDMHSDMSQNVGVEKEKLKADMQWTESMLQTKGQSVWGNALFEKQADGSYVEVSDAMGAENYWPWGLSVGDLNADGFDDVFIASSMNIPFRYAVNSVLLNNRGKKFLDSEFILGVEPRRDGVTAKIWFTLDCDGPDKEHSYAKQARISSGKVNVWAAVGSRSSVIFDMDNDGDLDIVTNEFNSPPMVLESNFSDDHEVHFLKVELQGTKSNRDALGAIVEVVTADGSYRKVHDGQSGYLSQSSQRLYFGLADATGVKEVRVTWPSGGSQVVASPEMDGVLKIVESAN